MVETREIDYTRIILALLIATFLFSLGILLGYMVRMTLQEGTLALQNQLRTDILDFETISLMQTNYPCNALILDKSSEKLDSIGDMLTVLESKKGKDDSIVLEMKKSYSILELRHFLLVKDRNEKCSNNYTTLLYFYSNAKECKDSVDKVSFILTYLRNKESNLRVYSFDMNLDSDIINIFQKEYGFYGCYGVVLNDKKIEEPITDSSQLEQLIK